MDLDQFVDEQVRNWSLLSPTDLRTEGKEVSTSPSPLNGVHVEGGLPNVE